jgi:hypothetical protein
MEIKLAKVLWKEESSSRPTVGSLPICAFAVHDSFVGILDLSTLPLTVVLPRMPTLCIAKSHRGQVLRRKTLEANWLIIRCCQRFVALLATSSFNSPLGCNGLRLTLALARPNDSLTPRA